MHWSNSQSSPSGWGFQQVHVYYTPIKCHLHSPTLGPVTATTSQTTIAATATPTTPTTATVDNTTITTTTSTIGSCLDFSEGTCDLSDTNIVGKDSNTDTPAECQVEKIFQFFTTSAPTNSTVSEPMFPVPCALFLVYSL